MLRRKLFAYSVMLSEGIAAGYIFSERLKIPEAFCLLLLTGLIIQRIYIDGKCNVNLEKKILLSILLAGFIAFNISYISMNSQLVNTSGEAIELESVNCIKGTVCNAEYKDDVVRLTVDTKSPISEKVVVSVYEYEGESDVDADNLIGMLVSCNGTLKKPKGQTNPLCFDYSVYLKSKGIRYTFSAKSLQIEEKSSSRVWKYRRWLLSKRKALIDSFGNNQEVRAFIKGVVFGDKSEIDENTIEEFNENSTGHILAVSGLHIGFLFALLKFLSRKRRGVMSAIIIIAVVLLYGEMTLWSPSTVRAVIVMSISLISTYLLRRADILTSVSLASILILLANPYQLFNSGFQMSFLAMLGISFLVNPLSYLLGDYLAMLVAVQAAVMPYTAYTFNRINVVSILINIPIVFLASVLVPLCLIQLLLISISGNTFGIINDIVEGLSVIILRLNSWFNADGVFSGRIVSVNAGLLATMYILVFFASSEWFRIKLIRHERSEIRNKATYIVLIGLCLIMCTYNQYSQDQLTFVDVGQGACLHIRVKEGLFSCKNYLIDGGGSEDYEIGTKTLEPYLLKSGVSHIDIAFVTHLHTDHYKGICELAKEGMIDRIIVFEGNKLEADTISEDTGLSIDRIGYMKAGDMMTLDCEDNLEDSKAYIEVLWPKSGTNAEYKRMLSDEEDENSMSLVFKLTINKLSVIISGDLDEDGESELINLYGKELKSDILSVAHHGSKYSSSEQYLDIVKPQIAVIQVGTNMYGHPTPETLARLEERVIPYYRNDTEGAVGIRVSRIGSITAIHTMN